MDESVRQKDDIISAKNISAQASGSAFTIDRAQFSLKVVGRHNIQNALAAIAVGYSIGLSFSHMSEALSRAHAAPGRFEEIPTKKNFRVFVDYAHEPASLRSAYEAVKLLKPRRLIAVLGSQGGGRDTKKRPVMGAIAAEYADVVIVTNEDPYDEPPENIIDDVAKGVLSQEKKFIENENVFKIIDRREAIHKALSLASDGGVVFVSGKGGEQVMAIKGGKNMPWDDREVIKAWLGS